MLLTVAFCLCDLPFLHAQAKGTSEVKAGIGVLTDYQILYDLEDFVSLLSFGLVRYENARYFPTLGVSYKYAIADKCFLFAEGYHEVITYDVVSLMQEPYSVEDRNLTFGIGAEYYFVTDGWLQIYSGLSLATSFNSEKSAENVHASRNKIEGRYQVNALGIRIGQTLGFTAELGLGYRGTVNMGIVFQFKNLPE